jgi:hypothetical protein
VSGDFARTPGQRQVRCETVKRLATPPSLQSTHPPSIPIPIPCETRPAEQTSSDILSSSHPLIFSCSTPYALVHSQSQSQSQSQYYAKPTIAESLGAACLSGCSSRIAAQTRRLVDSLATSHTGASAAPRRSTTTLAAALLQVRWSAFLLLNH